jgi:prolyl-tRNA synthetase
MDGHRRPGGALPGLLPREAYEVTGRWDSHGDGPGSKDRKGADYLLVPLTHEEVFTLLVKDLCSSSYKDLPSIYQIQDKYRDGASARWLR